MKERARHGGRLAAAQGLARGTDNALEGLLYYSAPLGFIPVAMCSGVRRETGKFGKYAYYVYYPIIMAVFALWVRLL